MFPTLKFIFTIFILFYLSYSFALNEDKKNKVYITADSSIYNYKTGVDTYEGNVIINQGTTHITADRLITKRDQQHKIFEAIAYGFKNKAHYWTTPRKGDPIIHATAQIIKFYPIEANITLEKNVKIKQQQNTFHGELIHYNKNAQTITVPASKHARAVIVFTPS